MGAWNFQREFAAAVAAGVGNHILSVELDEWIHYEKRQTMRRYRVDGRDPVIGESMALYTGQRTKSSTLLGHGIVTVRMPVRMCPYDYAPSLVVGGSAIAPRGDAANDIARRDGFDDADAMYAWFRDRYGHETFHGYLYRWVPEEDFEIMDALEQPEAHDEN